MKYKFLTLSLLLAGVCATTIKAQETNYYTPKWSDNIFISVGGGIHSVANDGFTLGAKKADLIAAAEEKGYSCDEDGDYLNIYKTADTKIDNRAQFWFNKDEDPDTVASVAYRNEILPE